MRKGVSEALAVIMILSITTAIFGTIALSSSQLLELGKISARDSISIAKDRVEELLSIIYKYKDSTSITIILINYGTDKITLDKVMVDGTVKPYNVYYLNSTQCVSSCNIIPQHKPLKIVITASGSSVQLITAKGNVFDIDV